MALLVVMDFNGDTVDLKISLETYEKLRELARKRKVSFLDLAEKIFHEEMHEISEEALINYLEKNLE